MMADARHFRQNKAAAPKPSVLRDAPTEAAPDSEADFFAEVPW